MESQLTELKSGIDSVLKGQETAESTAKDISTRLEKVEGDYVPREDFDSTKEWITAVEAAGKDLLSRGRSQILPAIPERCRGLVANFERTGLSEDKAIMRAGLEAWCKLVLTLQNPQKRADLDMGEVRTELDALEQSLNPQGFEKATLTGDEAPLGGYTIPVPLEAEVLRQMEDEANIRAVARVVPMTSRVHEFPTLDNSVTVSLTDENATIPDGVPAAPFGQRLLRARKFTCLGTMSSEVLQDSNIGISSFLVTLMTEKLALKEEFQALEGDGVGANFTGVATVSGTNSVVWGVADGDPVSYANLVNTKWGSRKRAGRRGAAWFGAPEVWQASEGLVSTTGAPIWSTSMQQGIQGQGNAEGLLLGFPAYSNADTSITRAKGTLTDGTIVYFGNWRSLIIGDLLGISFASSEHVNFKEDQVVLRMIKRTAIMVGVPLNFSISDLTDVS